MKKMALGNINIPGLTWDAKAKKTAAVVISLTLFLFLMGILIGFLSGRGSKEDVCNLYRSLDKYCSRSPYVLNKEYRTYYTRSMSQYKDSVCVQKDDSCHTRGLPRHYIAYHLGSKTINMDGKGDDDAWSEVPWTENFVDIRAKYYPNPKLVTKYKVRWSDDRLYILAWVQDDDIWAVHTSNDSNLWKENQIEVLMDVDGSLMNYKQIQMNVLGGRFDLMFVSSPYDLGGWDKGGYSATWNADIQTAIYADGTVNTPGDTDKYWSIEMSMSFSALNENCTRTSPTPSDNESWFMQFGRGHWKLNVTDGAHERVGDSPDWWSWNPVGSINLHLQDRWGLVQFKKDLSDKKFQCLEWHIYNALFDMFNGMKKYFALNGQYTDKITDLEIPINLLSNVCVEVPTIKKTQFNGTGDFEITVKSRLVQHLPSHIDSKKRVWFK